jgi:HSP20 family protein
MTLTKRHDGGYPTLRTWLDNIEEPGRFFEKEFLKDVNMPAVNVKETEKTYEIEVAAPGLDKKDFHVTLENNVLMISVEKEAEREEKEESYSRREFNYYSFRRSFRMPEDVKSEEIQARYENGILKLSLMKTGEKKMKKEIEIS